VAEFISKVTLARPNSPSLRTTIPEGIAKMIELNAGDELLWKISIKANNVEIKVSKKIKIIQENKIL
jgi:hypothetical protein